MHNGVFQGQIYNIYSRLETLVPQAWKHVKLVQTRTALHAFYRHMRGQAN